MGALSNLIQLVLPKKAAKKPTAFTNTYNPALVNSVLSAPGYRDHLTDIATQRTSLDSRDLLQLLFKMDPDMSAAVSAYLTVADTKPIFYVRNLDGSFDAEGFNTVTELLQSLGTRTDYSKGFERTISIRALCEQFRYMVLLRGAIGVELVLDKNILPTRFNMIDMATIEWTEKEPGVLAPQQKPKAGGNPIDLSKLPTFFVAYFHQDPTSVYPEGVFVSAINTIVARQQVINDLYRIMQVTGYPRIDVSIVEEVLLKNAPADVASNQQKLRDWVNTRLTEVANTVANTRPDQPLVHTDSTVVSMINDKNPGMTVDISHVISVLNGQNQAALKTMATIIGRGESGVNTASVEARIFSMNADQLNRPVADILSQALTFALRLLGSESFVEVEFRPAELRSELELEPQLTLKAARLQNDLSRGLITDLDYHVQMYGHPPAADAPELSGTNFLTPAPAPGAPDAGTAANVSGNDTSLGRAVAPKGSGTAKNMTKSKAVKK